MNCEPGEEEDPVARLLNLLDDVEVTQVTARPISVASDDGTVVPAEESEP